MRNIEYFTNDMNTKGKREDLEIVDETMKRSQKLNNTSVGKEFKRERTNQMEYIVISFH